MFGSRTSLPEDIYVVETNNVPWWMYLSIGALLTLEAMGTIAEYRHKRTLHNRINRAEMVIGKQIREARNVSDRVKNINTWRQTTEKAIAGLRRVVEPEESVYREPFHRDTTFEPPNVEIQKDVRAA